MLNLTAGNVVIPGETFVVADSATDNKKIVLGDGLRCVYFLTSTNDL
jgi:hypothetical protein